MKQNRNYTIVLVIGILSSFIYSCGEEDIDERHVRNYNYTNGTDFPLTIEEWKNGMNKSYNLGSSEQIVFKIELGAVGGVSCSVDDEPWQNLSERECLLVTADSLKIVFDGSRVLALRPDDPRDINIFNHDNYDYERNGNVKDYSYTFTQKDYDLAEDCNGNCD